jgi:uncharacterized protein (TIGR02001 family)
MMKLALRPVFAGLVLMTAAAPALAQSEPEAQAEVEADEAESGLDLSANIGIVSDYRFRGVSLSDRDPALQGGLDLEGEHFFIGTWASTIADYEGAEVEVDIYAGVQGGSDSFGWSAGAYAYLYPGGTDVNYAEATASAETYLGPLTLGLEAAYAPEQDNVDDANITLGVSVQYETPPGVVLLARGGYEDGFYEGKWDWELGASYTRGVLTASLSYVDSNYGADDEEGRLARAGIVASLLATF